MNILVAGLGKLGSVMAALTASAGHTVIGVDPDYDTYAAINSGKAPVDEPGLDRLIADLPVGRLTATTRYAQAVTETDLAVVVVPTPSLVSGDFDPELVVGAVEQIGLELNGWKRQSPYTVIVASTLSPRSVRNDVLPALEKASGLTVGEGVYLAYAPEFIALGTVIKDMTSPDMVLIGTADRQSARCASDFSRSFRTPVAVHTMSFEEAEVTKLAINGYLSVKIGYANMVGQIVDALDGDPRVVLEAIGADRRIGTAYLRKGGPPTGPCLPRDLVAFATLGKDLSVPTPLIHGAKAAANAVVDDIIAEIGAHRTVAILGVAYKPGSPITDDSLGRTLIKQLVMSGRKVVVHDPHASLPESFPWGYIAHDTVDAAVANAGIAVIACPHPEFDNLTLNMKVINPWT